MNICSLVRRFSLSEKNYEFIGKPAAASNALDLELHVDCTVVIVEINIPYFNERQMFLFNLSRNSRII
jgi:hypothetical protein